MLRRRILATGLGFGALAALGLGSTACQRSPAAGSLRVGLLPIIDSLPIYVAESEGIYSQQGLDVTLTLFPSALERDAALQAGQLDVVLNDLVSAILLNKDADRVRVVRLAYRGNPKLPMMIILAAPNSSIRQPSDLRGVDIGISGNTVIEFATDKLLEGAGLAPSEIKKTEVTKIPVRAEMLARGQIQAATLPEPLASLAAQQGARRVIDDGPTGIGQSVITARRELTTGQASELRRFLTVYEQAVSAIAKSPEQYRSLFVDKAKIPESLKDVLPIPPYPTAQVSTRIDLSQVVVWAIRKGLVPRELPYEQMVDGTLLPAAGLA